MSNFTVDLSTLSIEELELLSGNNGKSLQDNALAAIRAGIHANSKAIVLYNTLTQRQKEIVSMLVFENNPSKTCERLHITMNTYQTHMKQIRKRLGVDRNHEIPGLLKGVDFTADYMRATKFNPTIGGFGVLYKPASEFFHSDSIDNRR